MFRILIFNASHESCTELISSLESEFEVTTIKNSESLDPLIHSWHPHVLLVNADDVEFLNILPSVENLNEPSMGRVYLQKSYSLRTELLAYEHEFDHYLIKNTPTASLKARLLNLAKKMKAATNRQTAAVPADLPRQSNSVEIAGMQIMTDRRAVFVNGEWVKLTPTQHKILMMFLAHPNQLIKREWLMEMVFPNKKISTRTIDAHITKIKSLLPALKAVITSEYGEGYVLNWKSDRKKAA